MKKAHFTSIFLISLLGTSTPAEPFSIDDPGFTTFGNNCMPCHLSTGMGNREMNAPSIAGLPRWYVSSELRQFRNGQRGIHIEDPSGNLMRTNANLLDEREIAFLGRFIESLPVNTRRSTLDLSATPDSKQLYLQHCGNCHGENAQGNRTAKAPPLTRQQDWYLIKQYDNFLSSKRSHYEDEELPGIAIEEIHAIVAWLCKQPVE